MVLIMDLWSRFVFSRNGFVPQYSHQLPDFTSSQISTVFYFLIHDSVSCDLYSNIFLLITFFITCCCFNIELTTTKPYSVLLIFTFRLFFLRYSWGSCIEGLHIIGTKLFHYRRSSVKTFSGIAILWHFLFHVLWACCKYISNATSEK